MGKRIAPDLINQFQKNNQLRWLFLGISILVVKIGLGNRSQDSILIVFGIIGVSLLVLFEGLYRRLAQKKYDYSGYFCKPVQLVTA